MRLFASSGLVVLLFTSLPIGSVEDDSDKKETKSISTLIERLGSESYAARVTAAKDLLKLGDPAIPALKKAAKSHKSLEVKKRAEKLILQIIQSIRESKTLGLQMEPIKHGNFDMGSPRSERGRRPGENQHLVLLSKHFLLGKHEVTQSQFAKVMNFNPSAFAKGGTSQNKVPGFKTDDYPVESVTWYDAIEFCNRLSELDGYPEYYKLSNVERADKSITKATVSIVGGNGYRLPTEAEWEYACRAGTRTQFHYGTKNTGKEANMKATDIIVYGRRPKWKDLKRPTKTGSYKPNDWGLFDMHGNVAEWCWDWYEESYYTKSPKEDPLGPAKGNHRVVRGGSWLVNEGSCRSASRFWLSPDSATYHTGFRVARTP